MMGFGFGGAGMILMVFFWVFVVVFAIWLLSRLFPATTNSPGAQMGQGHGAASSSALDILKQRYARGEISKMEYDDIRRGLQA